jgi:hypothetical protein
VPNPATNKITTIGADGKQLATWSIGQYNAVALTSVGDLVTVAYETIQSATGQAAYDVVRTQVSVTDRTGKPVPGWPRTIQGPTSAAAAGPDGSLYLVLGDTITTGSILALDRAGNTESGWPVKLPTGYSGVAGGQSAGHANVSQPAIVGEGLVYVAATTSGGDQSIVAFKTSGTDHGGWSYRLPAGAHLVGSPAAPPVAALNGKLYIPEQTDASAGAVEALGSDGRPLPGWPYSFSPGPLTLTVLANNRIGVTSADFAAVLTEGGAVLP